MTQKRLTVLKPEPLPLSSILAKKSLGKKSSALICRYSKYYSSSSIWLHKRHDRKFKFWTKKFLVKIEILTKQFLQNINVNDFEKQIEIFFKNKNFRQEKIETLPKIENLVKNQNFRQKNLPKIEIMSKKETRLKCQFWSKPQH